MFDSYKPGGGNKPQPYIPAGNGDKSGEYTNKSTPNNKKKSIMNCYIKNVKFKYNFFNSKLVQKVNVTFICDKSTSIKRTGSPNSVAKKVINGFIATERYYNNKGEAYLDIDYTCHGNPKAHPYVPHIHKWIKDATGKLIRGEGEVFQ